MRFWVPFHANIDFGISILVNTFGYLGGKDVMRIEHNSNMP